MSWTIIFQTKIVKLPDGRIIHLNRSGCNNDNAGRNKEEFVGKLYTREEFEKFIQSFEGGACEIKIGSKSGDFVTYDDYAKHLRRMLKRATTWEMLQDKASKDFKHQPRICYTEKVDILYKDGSKKELSGEEFGEQFYKLIYDDAVRGYRHHEHHEYDIDKIVSMLDKRRENSSLLFEIA